MASDETCCTVATPRARNVQQTPSDSAHPRATSAQRTDLKALAHKVLARNGARNKPATEGGGTVQQTPAETGVFVAPDVAPLAAKLRALGQPIGLEVEGEVVAWIVADDEAAARAEVSPCFTAAEAEVLADFDAAGMRDLIEMKAKLGGTLHRDD